MSSRAKESLFSILRGWFEGATVIDLFAGVGTLGLEAISHGAERVALVERDHDVVECLRRNIAALQCQERCQVIQADALSSVLLAQLPRPATIAFMDPPYALWNQASGKRKILEQAARLRSLFDQKGWLVLRLPDAMDAEAGALPGFSGPEVRSYGGMHIHLYAPSVETGAPA